MRYLITQHLRDVLRVPGIWIYALLLLFLIALGVWAVAVENDLSFYWRDPAAIMNTGPWIGLFSNIGIFIWWIAGVVATFTAIALWRVPRFYERARFLLSAGILTGILALDDFFMIHEWVIPTYLPLSDDVMFSVYGIVTIAIIVRFRDDILRTRFAVLILACAFLGASIVIDVIGVERFQSAGIPIRLVWNLEYIVEDGFKLVGLIAWLHYFSLTSLETMRSAVISPKHERQ